MATRHSLTAHKAQLPGLGVQIAPVRARSTFSDFDFCPREEHAVSKTVFDWRLNADETGYVLRPGQKLIRGISLNPPETVARRSVEKPEVQSARTASKPHRQKPVFNVYQARRVALGSPCGEVRADPRDGSRLAQAEVIAEGYGKGELKTDAQVFAANTLAADAARAATAAVLKPTGLPSVVTVSVSEVEYETANQRRTRLEREYFAAA